MAVLTPPQIIAWYQASLHASGFRELDDVPREIWQAAVEHGKRALPPGFVGSLLERLTKKSSGLRGAGAPFAAESELLAKLCDGTGMEHLEGVFILAGSSCEPGFLKGVLLQILDRIPGFYLNEITISPTDLERAFSAPHHPDPAFPAEKILAKVYKDALALVDASPFMLTATDMFEIGHPDLFQKPADRTFYRVMMRAVAGVHAWTSGVFTFQEETPGVVAMFGEPQVLALGGYDSLATQGDISSLVPSELAYMDETMAVDLFDYKFLENQLLFYKREQGAVFRIRREMILQVHLTPFMEHERHLGLLFAWCLVLAEKILEVFVKDMMRLHFELHGFQPSALHDACEFFRLFLREKGNSDRVKIRIIEIDTLPLFRSTRSQWWLLGPTPQGDCKCLPLAFPQTDEFARLKETEQEKILGDGIRSTLERMVTSAHR
jgi:hypothetical protein